MRGHTFRARSNGSAADRLGPGNQFNAHASYEYVKKRHADNNGTIRTAWRSDSQRRERGARAWILTENTSWKTPGLTRRIMRRCRSVLLFVSSYSCSVPFVPPVQPLQPQSGCRAWRSGAFLCSSQSRMRPSRETVTTCQGMNLPLLRRAFSAARCSLPQQGTSMRRTVRLFTSFSRRMAVSFSV